ncbi:MAG TPA: glycosyltransferase [Sphingomonadaceae bacterium]|nr:glycosyltransferase [Sphingomonadaceae bacterium]
MTQGRLTLVRLIPVLDFGGAETLFEIQSTLIDRSRFDLRVCTFWKAGAAARMLEEGGVPVDVLDVDPSIRNPRATLALAKYLRRVRPDILQAGIGEANFHCALVAKACGVPLVIIEEHGLPDRPLPYRLVHAVLYRMVDAIIGVSKMACAYVVEREFAPTRRVHLLYNAIAQDFFAPVQQRKRVNGQFTFVNVGRLHPVKNQERLIRAFAPVAAAWPGARLVIVGDGESKARLAETVAELGLQDRVELAGYRDDVRSIVEDAHCFVFPSLTESFGIAALEAMARGLPCIASSGGALPEVVGDLGERWIVDALDVAAWTRALTDMMGLDATSYAALSRRAREIAERHTPERHGRELHELYDRLLAAKGIERPRD